MLKQVRGALKGIVLWFFVALLVLAFALFQVPEVTDIVRKAPLRVGDQSISQQEIDAEFNRALASRRREDGAALTREEGVAEGLHTQVVESIAFRAALEQEAKSMGLAMPRTLVRAYLENDERFKNPRTGKFDLEAMSRILNENRFTVREFEELIRGDLLRNQLLNAVVASAPLPRAYTDALLLREIERRDVAYLTVTDEMAGIAEEPTPVALKAYYEANAKLFSAPEYRSFTAVILRESDFTADLTVDKAELLKRYEANRPRLYDKAERRTIYQVVYPTEAEAQGAAERLRTGAPFEAIAAERGLSLEAATFADIERSAIVDPAVSAAAFASDLAAGGVAGPIVGVFGFAVIQVASVTPATTTPFEDVREEIEQAFFAQDGKRRLFEAVERIENERDAGAALGVAAERAGLKVSKFGPVDSFSFGLGGEIVADLPASVLKVAFSRDEGEETEALPLDEGDGYFFLLVDEIRPSAVRPFEDVEDEVAVRLRREERQTRIAATVRQIRSALAEGKSLEEAAATYNRTPVVAALTRQSASEVFSPALLEQAFSAEKGSAISGAAGLGEAQIVAVINDISFDLSRINPTSAASFGQFVSNQINQELVETFATSVRDERGVRINSAQIDAMFADGR